MHCTALLRCLVFVVALSAGCATRSDPADMVVRCTGAADTDAALVEAICDALAAELAILVPDRIVRRASPGHSSAGGDWEGVLEVSRTDRSVWEARLSWEPVGLEGGRSLGPPVYIVSSDAALGPRACRQFARSILEVSQPPL